jgi:hypothetical protein
MQGSPILSGIGFLQTGMGSGGVSVGAGEGGMWRWGSVSPGDRAPFVLPSIETRATTRVVDSPGDRAPPIPSPPPPLRGRGAFSPKNLYLKGLQSAPHRFGPDKSGPYSCVFHLPAILRLMRIEQPLWLACLERQQRACKAKQKSHSLRVISVKTIPI